jgi:fido (protein-threonine AMPylation protein)
MSDKHNWKLDLEEYIRQGEPKQAEKSAAWQTAIGLQAVDGLTASDYLLETAREHIEGNIDMSIAKRRIQNYYEQRQERKNVEDGTREADMVSVRIAEILGESTFQFSPVTFQNIHKRLFSGVFEHAGQIRTYNITKKEWVLNGSTVFYASCDSIRDTLEYDFNQEKQFSYQNLSVSDAVKHIAKFASDIWQIHPFCEGNTRATAVFIILYLKTFGFQINNDVFVDNSWYFRNSLVRANFNDLQNGIHATTEYLEMFFDNLLMDAHHELKNRYLHVDYQNALDKSAQSAKSESPKGKNCTLNCTLEEFVVLRAIADNPKITQKSLAAAIGKSERTVKMRMADLQEKGYLRRKNGRRNGYWELLVELS